jgi:hypothetical protein
VRTDSDTGREGGIESAWVAAIDVGVIGAGAGSTILDVELNARIKLSCCDGSMFGRTRRVRLVPRARNPMAERNNMFCMSGKRMSSVRERF